ncbi:glycosyltransferase [archaeon]|nr:glycosyltransferase [archaeon]MBT6183049.1 glycosyltransferase [archaeon]MBT6606371.1 glycosyltransferase [archaeon]MBT7251460.1 glycosyltransferase [archaeon]MBT7661246.1 glycosyltransferase [archaeon]
MASQIGSSSGNSHILFLGTYPPRECGIATFTKDLTTAIEKKFSPSLKIKIAAVNKNGSNMYNYPESVVYKISDSERGDYVRLAREVNSDDSISCVCIQHEYGIFGGNYGSYLLDFLREVTKPVIVTFHSLLPRPNPEIREVTRQIAEYAQEIVIMNRKGIEILKNDYEVTENVTVIPHGIPNVAFNSQKISKKRLGLKDRVIISSFGMVGPGKGYEEVIRSLPSVVEKFPNLTYLIVGQTHPVVRKNEGENYRNFLEQTAKDLGLTNNVKFYNRYLSLAEIIKFLSASDVYMMSNQNPNQITSGPLVYSMGVGRAIISTPFLHAQEEVTPGRGFLTSFGSSKEFSDSLLTILSDDELRHTMEKNNYLATRRMIWSNVALSYKMLFEKHILISSDHELNLPKINTRHLLRLTNKFGMVQFTKHLRPDISSGYTLDDNARALHASAMLYSRNRDPEMIPLIKIYLNYISYVQNAEGKLFNVVDKHRNVIFDEYSEEAEGRAIEALGYICSLDSIPRDIRGMAEILLLKTVEAPHSYSSPRTVASTVIGLCNYNRYRYSESMLARIRIMCDFLVSIYRDHVSETWKWFEPYLTYDNSKLSGALLHAYMQTQERDYLDVGISSLDFLIGKQFENGVFVPIGQREWCHKGADEARSYFDQQPVEAASKIFSLLLAHQIFPDRGYKERAVGVIQWFFGKNTLCQSVYNDTTGGCHDGLGEQTINLNQGAESTLAYLMSRLSFD